MLGKAIGLNVAYITAINYDLDDNIIDWFSDHANAEVIDIKFTSAYDSETKRMIPQALIIYKEANNNAQT